MAERDGKQAGNNPESPPEDTSTEGASAHAEGQQPAADGSSAGAQPPGDGKRSLLLRVLDRVEQVGNKLPHPATLFALFALATVVLSEVILRLGIVGVHPGTGEEIRAVSLLNADGLRFMWAKAEYNFVHFPPLGLVLVAMIGIGVAEGSGLITALLRQMVLSAPRRLVTAAVIAAGILSHLAASAGYIVLIPLGAMIFLAFRRHPMAGLAAAFCGVSGGFGANFLIGAIDPILAGLSQSAAQLVEPEMTLSPAINFYFMVASAFLVVIVGTFVTERIVEPRLGTYTGDAPAVERLTPRERKGLMAAGVSMVVLIGVGLLLTVPEGAILRDPKTGDLLRSPFMSGLITAILVFFLVPGVVYGIVVGSVRSDKDVLKHMTTSMKGLAAYIVLVFFAAQFVYYFKQSNMGVLLAIKGAELLKAVGLTGIPLLVGFVAVSAFVNMFMGSASAKWAIMAPIFVPMLMLVGYHPGVTQAAFRIGDSLTNIVTPMMSYFALIVAYAQKYDERYGMGTIISTMMPYTVALGIAWTLLLAVWMLLGLPIGPDAPILLPGGAG